MEVEWARLQVPVGERVEAAHHSVSGGEGSKPVLMLAVRNAALLPAIRMKPSWYSVALGSLILPSEVVVSGDGHCKQPFGCECALPIPASMTELLLKSLRRHCTIDSRAHQCEAEKVVEKDDSDWPVNGAIHSIMSTCA